MIKLAQVIDPARTLSTFLIIITSIIIAEFLCHVYLPVPEEVNSHFLKVAIIAPLATFLVVSIFVHWNRVFETKEKPVFNFEKFCFDHTFIQQLFDKATDMIQVNDSTGKILYMNHVAYTLLGYSKDEIINKSAEEILHPYDRKSIRDDIRQVLQGHETAAREVRLLKKKGGYLDAEIRSFPINADGDRRYAAVLIRNISSFKKNEILLQVQDEWEKMFNSIGDFVSIHDKDYRIVKANKALCDFLGKRPEEIIGKPCYQIFHDKDEPFNNCPHKKVAETGDNVSDIIYDLEIGVPLRVTCSPIHDDNGDFGGTVHIARIHEEEVQSRNDNCNIIPICAACKCVRTEESLWVEPEEYFVKKYKTQFTHAICMECRHKLYKDIV